ncbi:MAG: hypothetical protein L0K69_11310, partial [Enterobacterales bacterium]|nr:hypothetical protein [Enterobacterales bacterium]
RIVGSEFDLTNQTSELSIGLTSWYVARMFIKYFQIDSRKEISVTKNNGTNKELITSAEK